MAVVSYVSWRTGRSGYGMFHLTRDAKFTLCGKRPDGHIHVWEASLPPSPLLQCKTCRLRLLRELRNR